MACAKSALDPRPATASLLLEDISAEVDLGWGKDAISKIERERERLIVDV